MAWPRLGKSGVLSVDNVSFGYRLNANVLVDVSFTAQPGEVVEIVGRNGAGKSTLLRLLNGLLTPGNGHISVDGMPTATTPVHVLARHIGTVFQAPEQQIFNPTVEAEIAFGPRRLGLAGAALRTRVGDVLDRVGLAASAARHPLDLDQGALRFVAIGSVLAMRPPILLLDEPQRGLDAAHLARLEAIIADEAAAGSTIVIVCHDMDFVARRASRVVAFAERRVVADCATLAFFCDPDLTRRAGVEVPETLQLAQLLGLPPALTAVALAQHWIAARANGVANPTG
jgi:energy-coupling factor transport system ATP-binding protein